MKENKKLKRRQFIKKTIVGGIVFLQGCSKNVTSLDPEDKDTTNPPLPSTKVVLYRTTDRIAGVKKIFEILDFPSMQNKNIIVKPNFNTADPAPASTHNDTLSQIITEIKNRSASEIVLAERSYQSFNEVIEKKGINTLAKSLNFKIINLEREEKIHFIREGLFWKNGFQFPKCLSDAEYIVSTCCLKTHQYGGGFTMSLKLSVGCLPSLHMAELHNSAHMRDMIAEINLAYKPKLIIMDGIKAFISGGPSQGTERSGNVMIAGMDRVAIDVVGLAILKKLGSTKVSGKIFEQDQIKRAVELEIGIKTPNQIEFITPDDSSKQYAEELKSILFEG
jgi:uncharacterized protein (DUF362 family)